MRLSLRFRQLSHKSYAALLNLNRLCGTTTIATHTHTTDLCISLWLTDETTHAGWGDYHRSEVRTRRVQRFGWPKCSLQLTPCSAPPYLALPCRVLWRVGVNNNMKLQQQRTGDFVGGKKRFEVFALLWFELFWFDVISQRCSLMFFDMHQHTLAQRATCCTQYRE